MSDPADRAVTTDLATEDRPDNTMRPQELSEFIGQKAVRENLSVFINAAKKRREALDHTCLLYTSPSPRDRG